MVMDGRLVMLVFLLFQFALSLGGGSDGESDLVGIYPVAVPVKIYLKPGSVGLTSINCVIRKVDLPKKFYFNFTLSGEEKVCLSARSYYDNKTNQDNCSSFSVIRVEGGRINQIDVEFRYNASQDKNIIHSNKSLFLVVTTDITPTPFQSNRLVTIITTDGRKLRVGFIGSLHRLTTEANSSALTILRFNQTLNIDRELTVTLTLRRSSDGRVWEKVSTISLINEMLTNATLEWPHDIEKLLEGYFYEAELSTDLSDIVELQPSKVKIYPSRSTKMCGELADSIRGRVGAEIGIDQNSNGDIDQWLSDMCLLVPKNTAESPSGYDSDVTMPETIPQTTQMSLSTATPLTTQTEVVATVTSTATASSTTGTVETPPNHTVSTHENTAVTGADTTSTTENMSSTTPPLVTEDNTGTEEGGEVGEGGEATQVTEEGDSHVMWWAFFVFLALLIVGVSGYLLFNHHAKVKVYFFQLVGKGGSTVSSITSRRGKGATAKYTPLPTNVRETMLHQD